MRFPAALALVGLLAAPATASDFSDLARPEFGRLLLMSLEQREEMACAEGWIEAGADAPLAPLIAEMDERHAIALGSRRFMEKRTPIEQADPVVLALENAITAEGVTDPGAATAPTPSTEDARKARLASLPPRCATIAHAFETGGLASATALLAPRPTAAIALPPTGQCLKQLENGRLARDDVHMARNLSDIRKELKRTKLLSAEEKAAIARDYAAFVPPALKTSRADEPWSGSEMDDFVCFPVLAALVARLAGRD